MQNTNHPTAAMPPLPLFMRVRVIVSYTLPDTLLPAWHGNELTAKYKVMMLLQFVAPSHPECYQNTHREQFTTQCSIGHQ